MCTTAVRDYLEEESEDEDKETREGPGFQVRPPLNSACLCLVEQLPVVQAHQHAHLQGGAILQLARSLSNHEAAPLQADLPPQRKRPQGGKGAKKGPPPDEAKWLTSCVLAPGAVRGGPSPSSAVDLASLPIEKRCAPITIFSVWLHASRLPPDPRLVLLSTQWTSRRPEPTSLERLYL